MLLLAATNSLPHPRLGLIISKKNVRRAVDRNRIKRLVRESFRLSNNLPCADVIFLARGGIAELNNQQLNQAIERAWQQIIKKASRQQKPHGNP